MFKVGDAFAHSQSEKCGNDSVLFATVSTQWKGVFVWICDNGWNMDPPINSGVKSVDKRCPKQPKTQTSTAKVLASVF